MKQRGAQQIDGRGPSAPAGTATLTRRSLLKRGVAAGAAVTLPAAWHSSALAASAGACKDPKLFRSSLSVSPFTELVLAKGVTLTDGSRSAATVEAVQKLFKAHGATEVYARIATRRVTELDNEGNAEMGFERGLERARLARSVRLPFNPELGLFRSYGDGEYWQEPPDFTDYPEIQLPAPWLSLTIEQMVEAMRQYGELVARQILSTRARVDYWDLGNEVEFGISGVAVQPLIPTTEYEAPDTVDPAIGLMSTSALIAMPDEARIAWCNAHLWPYIGQLLAAAADGIRAVQRHARFSTHIAGIGAKSSAITLAFWETMASQGYEPTMFGSSFYPTSPPPIAPPDPLGVLSEAGRALLERHGRKLFVAEYGYPSEAMEPPYPFDVPVAGYPLTPEGQAKFTHDLVAQGAGEGWLGGLRPWAPDFCDESWQPMSWFTKEQRAQAKPALAAVPEALAGTLGCRR